MCSYKMSFLNGCKGSKNASYGRTVFQIKERDCQWEHKQQQSRDFVHRAVNRNESLLNDKSRNDIEDFDQSDDANPDIEPNGNVQNRKQLHQTYDDKNNIRNRVQLCAQFACRMSLSCDPAIDHIGNTCSNKQGEESRRESRKKQQGDAAENSENSYAVGESIHCCKSL